VKVKWIQIRKEEVKVSLFGDDTILLCKTFQRFHQMTTTPDKYFSKLTNQLKKKQKNKGLAFIQTTNIRGKK
jgi:hypothetical protein